MSDNRECDCSRRSFLKGAGLTLAGFGLILNVRMRRFTN